MKHKVCILSIVYLEPEWAQTNQCIQKCGVPVVYVDRKGVGSMAKSYNRGFEKHRLTAYEYVWFVSNVTFEPDCLGRLVEQMDKREYAAIHPSFDSDHWHTKPQNFDGCTEAPFLEFTAPIIRSDVFYRFPLDEKMPYWGHDLDWGHRLREVGHKLGVYHGTKLGHAYIRHSNQTHPITAQRHAMRKQTDAATRARLVEKYGPDWRKLLWREKP